MLVTTLQPALMIDPDRVRGDAERRGSQGDDRQGGRGFAAAYVLLGAAPSGLLLGWLIDSAAGTAPWFLLGCSTLFVLVALVHLLRTLR